MEADRARVRAARGGASPDSPLALAVARLLDTIWRGEADALLRSLSVQARAKHAGFSYAEGLLATTAGATDEAIQWLTRAQSTLTSADVALAARVAFELGFIYAARGERHVAEAIVAWGDGMSGVRPAADVIHLNALMETLIGNHAAARLLYHQAVAGSAHALTPRSRVLALSNLAVSLTHTDPLQSVHLSGLALATHRSHRLHPRAEPAMRNVLGYALICCAMLPEARRVLESVVLEANSIGHRLAELYALFNLAIITELIGDAERSAIDLKMIETTSLELGLSELAGWCRIRLAWLDLLQGQTTSARTRIEQISVTESQSPAADMVQALIARQAGRLRTSADSLRRLVTLHRARADELSAFACLLWLGIVEEQSGHRRAALRSVHDALTIGQEGAFRLSANWWSPELVSVARRLSAPEFGEYARQLVEPSSLPPQPASPSLIRVSRDGSISVDGIPVPAERWSSGRAGSRVLRRLFVALIAAYPSALRRDELTDFMWPDSDGDKAVANLYSATNDLRTILADVPGVALTSRDGAYALALGANVSLA